MHPSTPILSFSMDKNLKKLSWRSSVDMCEKRYEQIHAEKVGFLLKNSSFEGNFAHNFNVNEH